MGGELPDRSSENHHGHGQAEPAPVAAPAVVQELPNVRCQGWSQRTKPIESTYGFFSELETPKMDGLSTING